MQQRKKYSDEFKREAVGLTRLPGANVSQIARDVGIRPNQLHRWRRELDASGKKAFPGAGTPRAVSYTHLDVYKRQVCRLVGPGWWVRQRDGGICPPRFSPSHRAVLEAC